MCQVPLKHSQMRQAVECIGIFLEVAGWVLAHVVAVRWGAPQQLADDIFMVGLGLALFVGATLVHL